MAESLEQQRKRAQQLAAQERGKGFDYAGAQFPNLNGNSKGGDGNLFNDPLGTILDLVTRPLQGVSNAIESGVQAATDAQKSGNPLDFLSVPFKTVGGGLYGTFAADDEAGKMGAPLLEKLTDIRGSLDPNYVDRVNNVDPGAAAIGGLAFDLLADPLNLVGTGIASKALGKGVQAVKGGVEAAKAATPAATPAARESIEDILAMGDEAVPVAAKTDDFENVMDGAVPAAAPVVPEALSEDTLRELGRRQGLQEARREGLQGMEAAVYAEQRATEALQAAKVVDEAPTVSPSVVEEGAVAPAPEGAGAAGSATTAAAAPSPRPSLKEWAQDPAVLAQIADGARAEVSTNPALADALVDLTPARIKLSLGRIEKARAEGRSLGSKGTRADILDAHIARQYDAAMAHLDVEDAAARAAQRPVAEEVVDAAPAATAETPLAEATAPVGATEAPAVAPLRERVLEFLNERTADVHVPGVKKGYSVAEQRAIVQALIGEDDALLSKGRKTSQAVRDEVLRLYNERLATVDSFLDHEFASTFSTAEALDVTPGWVEAASNVIPEPILARLDEGIATGQPVQQLVRGSRPYLYQLAAGYADQPKLLGVKVSPERLQDIITRFVNGAQLNAKDRAILDRALAKYDELTNPIPPAAAPANVEAAISTTLGETKIGAEIAAEGADPDKLVTFAQGLRAAGNWDIYTNLDGFVRNVREAVANGRITLKGVTEWGRVEKVRRYLQYLIRTGDPVQYTPTFEPLTKGRVSAYLRGYEEAIDGLAARRPDMKSIIERARGGDKFAQIVLGSEIYSSEPAIYQWVKVLEPMLLKADSSAKAKGIAIGDAKLEQQFGEIRSLVNGGLPVQNEQQAFEAMMRMKQTIGDQDVATVLGPHLVAYFRSSSSEATFRARMDALADLLAPDLDIIRWLDDHVHESTAIAAVMRLYGIGETPKEIQEAVNHALLRTVSSNIKDSIDGTVDALRAAWEREWTHRDEFYPFQVKGSIRRTGATPATGTASRRQQNLFNNYTLWTNLMHVFVSTKARNAPYAARFLEVAERIRKRTNFTDPFDHGGQVHGRVRAMTIRELIGKQGLYVADELARHMDIPQFITMNSKAFREEYGLTDEAIALSLGDIYNIIDDIAAQNGKGSIALRHLWGPPSVPGKPGSAIPPTKLQIAVAQFLQGVDKGKILSDLAGGKAGIRGGVDTDKFINALEGVTLEGKDGKWVREWHYGAGGKGQDAQALADARAAELNSREGVKGGYVGVVDKGGKGYWIYQRADKAQKDLYDLIKDAAESLRGREAMNRANFGLSTRKEAQQLGKARLATIDRAVTDGDFATEIARLVDESWATRNGGPAPAPKATTLAQELVEGALGEAMVNAAKALRSSANKVAETERALPGDEVALAKAVEETSVGDDIAREVAAEQAAIVKNAQDEVMADEVIDELLADMDMVDPSVRAAIDDGADAARTERAAAEEAAGKASKKQKKEQYRAFNPLDTRDAAFARIMTGIARRLDPWNALKSMFVQEHGMAQLNGMRQGWENAGGLFSAQMRKNLNRLVKQHPGFVKGGNVTETIWPSVMLHLQGKLEGASPEVLAAAKALQDQVGRFVLPTKEGESFLDNILLDIGEADVTQINAILADNLLHQTFKTPERTAFFDLALAKQAMKDAKKAGGKLTLGEALARQWRDWDIADPIDFFARYANAVADMAQFKAAAKDFTRYALDHGLASRTPQPGFKKLKITGRSNYATFIEKKAREELYWDESIIQEMLVADRFSQLPRRSQNAIIQNYYLPALQAWKFGITQMRPGHHVRNFIGDSSITFVARGASSFLTGQKDAARIIAANRRYADYDAAKTLGYLGENGVPGGADVLVHSAKYGDFGNQEMWEAALQRGLLPSVYIGEDLFARAAEKGTGLYEKTLGIVSGKDLKIGELAGDLSEVRDHHARLSHFMQAIRQEAAKGRYASKEELLDAVAKEVRKYHPDASMLSNFESKYMRLIIPFYSWFRGVLPAIAESSMRNPARVLMFPKASYAIAYANGLNPDTLSNPFPDDQLFPSFLTKDMLGPQFQIGDSYINVNPGIAHIDVFNTLGTDPLRNMLGMTTPFLRVPAELASMGSWSTGGRIQDASDYLDSSIPFVNYLSNLSGVSVTGSVPSLLSGQGLDPQRAYQLEEQTKGPLDKGLTAFNWLTGLGAQNYSRPNYENYAEIEKRNAAAKEND